MAETKSGGLYLGTDGKLHDATGKVIVEVVQQEQHQKYAGVVVENIAVAEAADSKPSKKIPKSADVGAKE